ncbi:Phytochrome-like protein cph2 [bioreactor metagenome]|uniref:Phytochrome-like protein cph2 n=1 Tax=bioreactor metagenome TaxID=1076179 RepID=A0A645G8D9_9ZZZZ
MIGIDYFKNYTDVFGHLKGDEALAMISQCLSDLFGRETDVICRYSEDVFAVLVISKSRVAATEHATRVLKRIEGLDIKSDIESTPVSVSQHLTVSIGISTYWPDIHPELTESTLDKLLASASSQLDKARENGRNRVCSTEGSSF